MTNSVIKTISDAATVATSGTKDVIGFAKKFVEALQEARCEVFHKKEDPRITFRCDGTEKTIGYSALNEMLRNYAKHAGATVVATGLEKSMSPVWDALKKYTHTKGIQPTPPAHVPQAGHDAA